MILKYQAITTGSPLPASMQAVLSTDSLTAFGSSTYKVSHVRIHKASQVLGCERNKPDWNEISLPLTHSCLPFDTRCTMKNELLLIKINSPFKTQLEAFMIRSPNFSNPEIINFLAGSKEWWNISIILVGLDWPISCSKSIFLIHSTLLGCLVLMLRGRSVWLSVGTAAHICHFPTFKYSVFLFRPFQSDEYFLPPTLPEVNSWYHLSARREEEWQGLSLFCSHESLCNVCKCTGSKKNTDCLCSIFRQFTALLQQTVSAERWKLHIVDTVTGNRSLRLPLHIVSAEPCPAEPEGLLSQKVQLQWRRRRGNNQPCTGLFMSHHCSFPISGEGTERASHSGDFPNCLIRRPVKAKRSAVLVGIKAAKGSQTTVQLTRCPLAISWCQRCTAWL